MDEDKIVNDLIKQLVIEIDSWPDGSWSEILPVGLEGEERHFSPDGTIAAVVSKDAEGKCHGLYQQFYSDGTVRREIPYLKGRKQGTETHWYSDGKIAAIVTWADGRPDGPIHRWCKNGHKRLEGAYRNGKLHGEARAWHLNGVLATEDCYNDGIQVGVHRAWRSNGLLLIEEEYGPTGKKRGIERRYHKNGQIAEQIERSMEPPYRVVGDHIWWNPDGTERKKITHKF